ncbi:hypothetical protein M422DRAFT_197706 [Sphaerobolus stellatus SS14]|nr:hypothetical protein M422DRAFT_197706 [Sphaerobolus stellatus SS14]
MTLNRTQEFRRVVEEKRKSIIPNQPKRRSRYHDERNALLSSKDFASEASTILNHINTLSHMLSSLRRPYLNVEAGSSSFARQPVRNLDLGGSSDQWSSIRYLSNEERDQIDLQARLVLSRCADKVKEMESLEKRRIELIAKQTNPVLRFLPSRLTQDTTSATSEFVAAHHAGITWFLNRRLAEVSQTQKEMQEERIKRQMERAKTLGSGAAKEAIELTTKDPMFSRVHEAQPKHGGWLDSISGPSGLASSLASTFTGTDMDSHYPQHVSAPVFDAGSISDDDTDDIELSSSQIMQFESENANLLRSMQDTLASVQLAESRLLDISALQMELVAHLTRQTEITEQLYEDAIATSSAVERGNVELVKAKQRGKDSRMFIFLFFVGASLALLFVHSY